MYILTESDCMSIEELKQKNMWSSRYISAIGLIPILKNHGENLIGLEIGVCRGENIIRFVDECPNIKHIDGVDPFIEYMDVNGGLDKDSVNKMRVLAEKNFINVDRITLHISTSREFVNNIEDKHYDFIFIDGNHSYEYVKEDIELWYPKLKDTGIFSGHDYCLPGVQKAVTDYRNTNRIYKTLNFCDNGVWWWYGKEYIKQDANMKFSNLGS